ncbi:MAG: hypothetical protein PHC69_02255 [Ruminiclostridium sp.]|nr:hypothetical protein [Ruminiclostridium sp.]
MGFINKALFPSHKVSLMVVDKRLEYSMKAELKKHIHDIIEIPSLKGLQYSVSGHPDMQIAHIKENILICQPEMSQEVLFQLKNQGFIIKLGSTKLKYDYPFDIAYNVAVVGNIAFHNTKYTDHVLVDALEKSSIRLIHVNQGYAKCSTLPITPESIITADPSIEKAALDAGLDVLKIPPQKNIHLPGLDYGFIGGTAGFIEERIFAFAGSINALDNNDEVKKFLNKYDVKWVNLKKDGIYDYGGLMPLCEI